MIGQVALTGYTLENVAYEILHKRIPMFSHECLTDWWNDNKKRFVSLSKSLFSEYLFSYSSFLQTLPSSLVTLPSSLVTSSMFICSQFLLPPSLLHHSSFSQYLFVFPVLFSSRNLLKSLHSLYS